MPGKSMYLSVRLLIHSFLLSLISFGAFAQTSWHLKKDEDGIKVYTASTEKSDFKSVRVDFDVRATFSELVLFLMDVNKIHEWVYANKSASLVKRFRANEFAFYAEVAAPWPCSNRDYVAHIVITQPSPKLIVIDSHSDPGLVPEKRGVVRVKKSSAHWEISNLGNGMLHIMYTVSFDPGGAVPAWLTNIFVTKGPLETFKALRNRVNLPEYKEAHFDFIND